MCKTVNQALKQEINICASLKAECGIILSNSVVNILWAVQWQLDIGIVISLLKGNFQIYLFSSGKCLLEFTFFLKGILASSIFVISGLQYASGKKRCRNCINYGDHGRC